MAFYLLKLRPPRATFFLDMTDDERTVMFAHAGYWKKKLGEGVAIAFGPVIEPDASWGLGIGIRVNSVAPGAVDTPMLWNNPNVKSGAEKIEGAIGKPEDLANAICFIASDDAKFINGTTLVVDGGRLDTL